MYLMMLIVDLSGLMRKLLIVCSFSLLFVFNSFIYILNDFHSEGYCVF